jgi:hypothetical protein
MATIDMTAVQSCTFNGATVNEIYLGSEQIWPLGPSERWIVHDEYTLKMKVGSTERVMLRQPYRSNHNQRPYPNKLQVVYAVGGQPRYFRTFTGFDATTRKWTYDQMYYRTLSSRNSFTIGTSESSKTAVGRENDAYGIYSWYANNYLWLKSEAKLVNSQLNGNTESGLTGNQYLAEYYDATTERHGGRSQWQADVGWMLYRDNNGAEKIIIGSMSTLHHTNAVPQELEDCNGLSISEIQTMLNNKRGWFYWGNTSYISWNEVSVLDWSTTKQYGTQSTVVFPNGNTPKWFGSGIYHYGAGYDPNNELATRYMWAAQKTGTNTGKVFCNKSRYGTGDDGSTISIGNLASSLRYIGDYKESTSFADTWNATEHSVSFRTDQAGGRFNMTAFPLFDQ